MKIKNKLSFYGIIVLILLFISFYFLATFFLDRIKLDNEVDEDLPPITSADENYTKERDIVLNIYQRARLIYDVVNSQFRVSSDDIITIKDITYKKIVNFDEVTKNVFTTNGIDKYINDFGSYFVRTDNGYYLASNLSNYQTYYFRGDDTSIYVLDADDSVINAIIYEKWTSNNKTTLATIKLVYENSWLIDSISILSNN